MSIYFLSNTQQTITYKLMKLLGREPWSSGDGRRLMSEGHGFKSQHRILDGHFSHLFVVKIVMFFLKRRK